jgi:hypothetical protein
MAHTALNTKASIKLRLDAAENMKPATLPLHCVSPHHKTYKHGHHIDDDEHLI